MYISVLLHLCLDLERKLVALRKVGLRGQVALGGLHLDQRLSRWGAKLNSWPELPIYID
jgi:hypothetical protein